jgi:hypothetical protein
LTDPEPACGYIWEVIRPGCPPARKTRYPCHFTGDPELRRLCARCPYDGLAELKSIAYRPSHVSPRFRYPSDYREKREEEKRFFAPSDVQPPRYVYTDPEYGPIHRVGRWIYITESLLDRKKKHGWRKVAALRTLLYPLGPPIWSFPRWEWKPSNRERWISLLCDEDPELISWVWEMLASGRWPHTERFPFPNRKTIRQWCSQYIRDHWYIRDKKTGMMRRKPSTISLDVPMGADNESNSDTQGIFLYWVQRRETPRIYQRYTEDGKNLEGTERIFWVRHSFHFTPEERRERWIFPGIGREHLVKVLRCIPSEGRTGNERFEYEARFDIERWRARQPGEDNHYHLGAAGWVPFLEILVKSLEETPQLPTPSIRGRELLSAIFIPDGLNRLKRKEN